MDSDEQLSPIGESSVPVPNRMLRRLKRATSISDLCPGSKSLDSEEDLGKHGLQSAKDFDGFEESDLEGLGVEDGVTAKKVLDFDSVPEFIPPIGDLGEKGDEEISDSETREEIRVPETNESGKERPDSDTSVPEFNSASEELAEKGEDEISDSEEIRVSETKESGKEQPDLNTNTSVPESDSALEELGEEEIHDLETGEEIRASETGKKRPVLETSDGEGKERKRNNKRNKKNVDFDDLPISSMNMTKKERREHLDQLRAENQRLLRETRDAAFEPVPLVRKPISSVLEKIRRRKEEISKQFRSRKKSKYMDMCDDGLIEDDGNDFEEVVAEERNEDTNLNTKSKQNPAGQDSLEEDSAGPSGNSDSPSNKRTENNPTHQDPPLRSQTTNSGDEIPEKRSGRSLEEVMTPSILAMNLKLNSSPAPDNSEEAEYIKENSDPDETHDSSPGDPVRKFIDEDAEEEDDSDNDLLRFEEEDEDDYEEDDDLRDMIVSQFKEDPTDKDRRNELHQKWLEQQDAAGTEKLLQKLKRGMQQEETLLSEDEDDADDEERAEDADDEEVTKPGANEGANEGENEDEDEDPFHAISMRMKIKKIKEMIPLMFTEEDDAYVSSDDEEMEKKLLQQRLYKKMEQKTKTSSLTGDENSEEILRYIKKPEIMKKAKPSFKEKALLGINKNLAASKSSFLGRITKNSTSEGSRKRGSNIVRGYIFERDDNNSKSSNSAPEEPLVQETIIQEKSRPKRAPAKFTASQTQERSATLQAKAVEEETSTRQRTTLFEILKMSSKKTCFTSGETVISSSHTESIFAAFKLDKNPIKTNP